VGGDDAAVGGAGVANLLVAGDTLGLKAEGQLQALLLGGLDGKAQRAHLALQPVELGADVLLFLGGESRGKADNESKTHNGEAFHGVSPEESADGWRRPPNSVAGTRS
jgi:hypothetical protein